jgi:hypothetical protein
MVLMRSGRTLWRMSTINLTAFFMDLSPGFAPVLGAPFFLHSQLQIPQSHFGAIPATCFVEDSSQVVLHFLLSCVGFRRDLCIRAPLHNQRRDRPLFTGQCTHISQLRHFYTHFKILICHLRSRSAIGF